MFSSRRRSVLIVVAAALAVGTSGIATIPFYTRGEPREALVVREMVEGAGWVLPLRNGTDLPRKPPFFHWLAAGAALVLGGVDEVAVRLPSAVVSVAAALFTLGWARACGGPVTGVLTALVTITSFEWTRAATVARVDMVYAGLLTAAVVSLDRLLRGPAHPALWRWLFHATVAAAVLTKGPIALVLTTLAACAVGWSRPETGLWQRLRLGRGLAAGLAVFAAWCLLAFSQHGSAFLDVVVGENVHHLIATDRGGTGHAHGPAYLGAMAAVGLLPWTPLLPFAGPALTRARRDPGVHLAAVWTGIVLAVHLLASAKRGVYLLPAYPAIALLTVSGARMAFQDPQNAWARPYLRWAAGTYVLFSGCLAMSVLALSLGFEVPAHVRGLLSPRDQLGLHAAAAAARDQALPLALAAGLIITAALLIIRAARRNAWERLIATLALGTACVAVLFNTAIHPELARQRSLKEFMKTVTTIVGHDEPLYFLGSPDAGAVFYSRRRIPRVPRQLTTPPIPYLLVWERDWLGLASSSQRPPPLKVSAVEVPRRGHLLLIATDAPGPRRASGAQLDPRAAPGAEGRAEPRPSPNQGDP